MTTKIHALVDALGNPFSLMLTPGQFSAKGLLSSLYTDRGSHYFFTPKAGEAVDKDRALSAICGALAKRALCAGR